MELTMEEKISLVDISRGSVSRHDPAGDKVSRYDPMPYPSWWEDHKAEVVLSSLYIVSRYYRDQGTIRVEGLGMKEVRGTLQVRWTDPRGEWEEYRSLEWDDFISIIGRVCLNIRAGKFIPVPKDRYIQIELFPEGGL